MPLLVLVGVANTDINQYLEGQIIDVHKEKEISKDIVEIIKIGFRPIVVKPRTDSGEPSSLWKKCSQNKILNNHALS